MKNCIKVSLLSILLLMFCTLAMNAAEIINQSLKSVLQLL